jgi:hypothetical protein
MKCNGLKQEKCDLIYPIFLEFKEYSLKIGKPRFKLEGFINFINGHAYAVVGYTWHQNEDELESQYYGRTAVSIFRVCECYANANKGAFVLDKDGNKVKLLNKVAPKTFEFIV